MKRFSILIIFIIVLLLIAKFWWSVQLSPVSSDTSIKVFTVDKGQGVSQIAADLKKQHLIRSELIFKLYVRQNNLTKKLQAGSFELSPGMSTEEILQMLQKGADDIKITLFEGSRTEEMADRLNQVLNIDKAEFLKASKEGYMFPDTYFFPKDATAEYMAGLLKKTFDSRFSADLRSKIKAKGLTEAQGVILASIVEREARSNEARKMVASILLKRFNINMALNADATIQYILGYQKGEKSWWKRHLSREDMQIDSPYNTYLYAGLPPAPIANPGLSSLSAVADADPKTPYLYYYHDSKGISRYGRTLEEHNQNVASYP